MVKNKQVPSRKDFKVLIVMPKLILTTKVNYNYMIPLGLTYISSAIKKAGYNSDCLNLNHREGTISEILGKELDKEKYDVVCTQLVGGPNYVVTEEIRKCVKEHSSHPKFIVGGALITSEPELIFNSLGLDFGVLGEGEITIVELLDCIKKKGDFSKVKGIIYKDEKGKTKVTEKREPIKDIESIPYPDFEGFEFKEYLKHLYCNQQHYNQSYDYPVPYPIMSSRSCPFQCTFCYHSIGYKYRERSIEDVINEIKMAIKKYKINIVALYDDMFSFKKERIYEFCEKIKEINKELPQKIKWYCQLSVVGIDKDLLKTMKDSGCSVISYGFESMDPKVLKSMRKPIKPEQIDFAIRSTLNEKIGIQGNFIFGDVAETKETAKKTLDYWRKNCHGQVGLGFIQPYPGSAVYLHCLKKGLIKDKLKFILGALEGKKALNMTDKMKEKEFGELVKEVPRLVDNYFRHITPLSVKKDKGGKRYKVKVNCPFCKKNIEYGNYNLQKRLLYRRVIYCRECGMRFVVVSSLMKLSGSFPYLKSRSEKAIRKIRSTMSVRNIK